MKLDKMIKQYWWVLAILLMLLFKGCSTTNVTNQYISSPTASATPTASPSILPSVVDTGLTCAQKAEQNNALFYNKEVSSAKECLDFAILDCQDVGKIIDGYAVSGTCCYFTCIGIVTPDPVICSDSDSYMPVNQYLQNRGTCTDGMGSIQDTCDNGMLREYYCEPGLNGGPNACGYTSYNCDGMIPGTVCQNGHCINLV